MKLEEINTLKIHDAVRMHYHGRCANVRIFDFDRDRFTGEIITIWGKDEHGEIWCVGNYEFDNSLSEAS